MTEGRRGTRPARTVAGAPLPRTGTPVVVITLIALDLLAFVVTAVSAGSIAANRNSPWFAATALRPAAVADGEWWRLLTSGFLHFGPLHLALNLLALWIIGRVVEPVLGPARFVAIYLTAMLGGSVTVLLFDSPRLVLAGASGAVFGLMGALLVLLLRMRLSPGPVLAIIAINLALPLFVPGISLLAHVGGLVTGAVTTAAFVHGPGRSRPALGFAVLAGVVVLLLALTAVRVAALDVPA